MTRYRWQRLNGNGDWGDWTWVGSDCAAYVMERYGVATLNMQALEDLNRRFRFNFKHNHANTYRLKKEVYD